MMVKHIVFDIGQVLVNVTFHEFLFKLVAEFRIDPSALTDDVNNGAHTDFMMGKINGDEFYRTTCEHFNHFLSIEEFKRLWLNMLGGQIKETALIVEELYKNRQHLSILSNIDEWHFEHCEQILPVLNRFEKKFLSYKMGLKKPDPEIFRKVALDLKVDAAECLLIDDKIENIESAHKVGFDVIHFVDGEQLRRDLILEKLLTN